MSDPTSTPWGNYFLSFPRTLHEADLDYARRLVALAHGLTPDVVRRDTTLNHDVQRCLDSIVESYDKVRSITLN